MPPMEKKSARVAPFRDPEVERSLEAAAEIGIAILKKYHGRIRSIVKKGEIDLLTRADRESEAAVLKYLRRRHPDHRLIGEETWDRKPAETSGYTWFLDPLDGTTNYAHGLDHYALSLGVAYDGAPVAGIVADPERGHVYRAWRGRGAFRDKKRLSVSSKTSLNDSLIATGFPYDRRNRIPELTRLVGEFLLRSQGIRRMGVAALDLAFVAAGQFDGFYEPTLSPWDVAAGMLLVTEAGGKVTDYAGQPSHPFSGSIIAAPPRIHAKMLAVIQNTLAELNKSGKA